MATRFSVGSPRSDRRYFRATADRTRMVNTTVSVPRGGFYF